MLSPSANIGATGGLSDVDEGERSPWNNWILEENI